MNMVRVSIISMGRVRFINRFMGIIRFSIRFRVRVRVGIRFIDRSLSIRFIKVAK